MPYVVRQPKRYDFCGCPPCPLCFDFVEPAPSVSERIPDDAVIPRDLLAPDAVVVDGLDKMAEVLLDKPIEEITKEEKAKVKDVAEDLHQGNIVRKVEGNPPPEEGATFKSPEEEAFFWKDVTQKREFREKEKAYQKELTKPKSLDQQDWGASEEAKELQKSDEEVKNESLKKAADQEAEKENARTRAAREAKERMMSELFWKK